MSTDNPLKGGAHIPQISWADIKLLAVEDADGNLHPIPEGLTMRDPAGTMSLASTEESRAYVEEERARGAAPRVREPSHRGATQAGPNRTHLSPVEDPREWP